MTFDPNREVGIEGSEETQERWIEEGSSGKGDTGFFFKK